MRGVGAVGLTMLLLISAGYRVRHPLDDAEAQLASQAEAEAQATAVLDEVGSAMLADVGYAESAGVPPGTARRIRIIRMSVTGVLGRFCWKGCQLAPSSNEI